MLLESVSAVLAIAGVVGKVGVDETQAHARLVDLDDDSHPSACGLKRFPQLWHDNQWVKAGVETHHHRGDDVRRRLLRDRKNRRGYDWSLYLLRHGATQVNCDFFDEADGAHCRAAASFRARCAYVNRRSIREPRCAFACQLLPVVAKHAC